MQHYIEQLIDDLHKATWEIKPPHEIWIESEADPDDELELEDLSYAEKYMYGDEQPISEITGINQEQLPPEEKLSIQQRALLAAELEKLLEYFHFKLDFPTDYPGHLRYAFIRKFWEEEHVALSFGENNIELCEYEEVNCPFPGYCNTCGEINEQLKLEEEEAKGKDLDFNFDIHSLLPTPEQVEKFIRENGMDTREDTDGDDIFEFSDDDDLDLEFVGGFFNDDGTPIDPKTIPVPELCMLCFWYYLDDPRENFLCGMNRHDQRHDPDFLCKDFEKI